MTKPNNDGKQGADALPIEPGHVMRIEKFRQVEHYQRLAREAAKEQQK